MKNAMHGFTIFVLLAGILLQGSIHMRSPLSDIGNHCGSRVLGSSRISLRFQVGEVSLPKLAMLGS